MNWCDWERTGTTGWSDLGTMADGISEEQDRQDSGKEEPDWGYEEGKQVSPCVQRNAADAKRGKDKKRALERQRRAPS